MKTKTKKMCCPKCLDLRDAIHKQLYSLDMVLDSLELKVFEIGDEKFNPMSYWDLNNLSGTIWAAKDNIVRVLRLED